MSLSVSRYHQHTRFWFVLGLAFVAIAWFANVAAAQDNGGAAGGGGAGGGGGGSDKPLILFMIESLGWIFGPLLMAVSVAMVALCRAPDPRPADEFGHPAGVRGRVHRHRQQAEVQGSVRHGPERPSFLGQVLTAGMSRLQYGLEDAREAAMNTLESIKSDKDQKNNYNAVIATLGPMFGLVGTVYGMIQSFNVLATGDAGATRRSWPTAFRMLWSLHCSASRSRFPAIFFNAFFKNRITRVTMDVGHIADDLLTQMYHNSKKPAAPAAAPPAPAPPGVPPHRGDELSVFSAQLSVEVELRG